ncbi:MAG: cation transporter [Moraxellaceae bacterium]|nr:cation transporter [Moraxellaceae bacterium]
MSQENEVASKVETKALLIGFVINLIMGFAGWYMFLKTDIDALFLDGNFSLISAIGCIVAIFISKYSHKTTERFPYGMYFLEPLYGTIKGLLSLVLIVIAGVSAAIKLYNYLFLNQGTMLAMGDILYYSILMTVLCLVMGVIFWRLNKTIDNRSTILDIEGRTAFVDGFISLGLGVAILLITLLPKQGNTLFVYYVGDALITLVMIIFMINIPIQALKESFIELVFGVIKPNAMKQEIETIIHENKRFDNIHINDIHIYKTGKNILVLITICFIDDGEPIKNALDFKQEVFDKIQEKYKVDLEMTIS